MADGSVAFFWLDISTEFGGLRTGSYVVQIQKASSSWGRADLHTNFGGNTYGDMYQFQMSSAVLNYSGSWGDPVHLTNVLGLYAHRPADANIGLKERDGSLNHYLATSTMTSNKPSEDGHIITLNWDNNQKNCVQFFLPNLYGTSYEASGKRPQIRGYRSSAGEWGPWESLALLSDIT